MTQPNTGPPAPWPTPAGPPAPREPHPPRASGGRTADVIVSVLLMVGGVIVFGSLAFLPLFIAAFADSCTAESCDADLMMTGAYVGLIAPPLLFLAAVIWGLIRLARRKTAWWVVAAGGVVAAIASGIAFGLLYAGIA
ncbi:DUF6264 family protein [Labedella endophytica]|uniref:Uncharacterized protein n=1 Tax=Labedella endophytica TaxID=1523160 RepID=A0A433JQ65_9MICO|nr:DUF6264 family protein [Labedella endophytica]RUQ98251.1 hypothetical protein ELQ94_14680 [Labedella endophytica]